MSNDSKDKGIKSVCDAIVHLSIIPMKNQQFLSCQHQLWYCHIWCSGFKFLDNIIIDANNWRSLKAFCCSLSFSGLFVTFIVISVTFQNWNALYLFRTCSFSFSMIPKIFFVLALVLCRSYTSYMEVVLRVFSDIHRFFTIVLRLFSDIHFYFYDRTLYLLPRL